MTLDCTELESGTVVWCDARPGLLTAEELPINNDGRFLAVVASNRSHNLANSVPSVLVLPLKEAAHNNGWTGDQVCVGEKTFRLCPELARKHPFVALHPLSPADAPIVVERAVIVNAVNTLFNILTYNSTAAEEPYKGIETGQIGFVSEFPYNNKLTESCPATVLVLSPISYMKQTGAALVARIRINKNPAKGYYAPACYPLILEGRLAHIEAHDIAHLSLDRVKPLYSGEIIVNALVRKVIAEMLMGAFFADRHKEIRVRAGDVGARPYPESMVATARDWKVYIPGPNEVFNLG